MLHFEVELEVVYELSSRLFTLHYLFTRFCFFFYLVSTWYVANLKILIRPDRNQFGMALQQTQGKKWNFLLWDTRLIGRGNAYAPTDFLTIGNAQFPTPIL